MKTKSFLSFLLLFALILGYMISCKESSRFETEENSTTPPGPPTNVTWIPINGGARFFYTLPKDNDLLSIDAEYTNPSGKTFNFTASYYIDSLDVIGLGSMAPQKISLYGVNRAGLRSNAVNIEITPLEPAVTRVAKTLVIKPGFSSFFVDWTNELKQLINVYVHFKYNERSTNRDIVSVFSSNMETDRKFISNLILNPDVPIEVSLRVEDYYGNSTEETSFGTIYLLEDNMLDKSIMKFPAPNDSTVVLRNGSIVNTGIPAMFGDAKEGRMAKILDGIIDRGEILNFFHTDSRGRNGNSGIANPNDWNIILDLGGYYRLSRIVTHQRHSSIIERGHYYQNENCGEFRLWVFNETTLQWDSITTQRTPIPQGITELEIVRLGEAGDMAYFYPDDPQYTIPTRWFRYEMVNGFNDNYSTAHSNINCMSELTIYGIKE
jgi:hypothetical protein